ncbi:MAG: S66 peptidase family protein [Acidobacteriota bacterium]
MIGRRGFLAAGIAAAAGGAVRGGGEPALVRPRALREGDTVGLITPATYVSDPDRLALVDRTVRYFGLRPKLGRNVGKRVGYLGGTDQERIDDLHSMFRDPEVKGVFAIRGGYGSERLLDRIDYALLRANPKVFLGYSDITAMHLAIQKRAGLVTFHGPVMISGFSEFTQKWFRRALFDTAPAGALTNPPEANQLRPSHTLRTVRPGRARGRLIGGNLTLVTSTLGTPYEIDTRGRILFIEDVDEQPYGLDRMLTQLRLAGKLEQAAGIVFGECSNCGPREFKPSFESTFSAGEVIDQILGKLSIPVLSGLTIGHTDDQLTLPLGVPAVLDADKGELSLEESGVI